MSPVITPTSKAIWAARLRRLEDASSDTSSVSSLVTRLLARSPITFSASAAVTNTQPHYHKEYAENVSVKKLQYYYQICFYCICITQLMSVDTFLHIVLLYRNLVNTELSENAVRIAPLCFFNCFFGLKKFSYTRTHTHIHTLHT